MRVKVLVGLIPRGLLCLLAGGLTALAFAPYGVYIIPFITVAFLFSVWRRNSRKKAFINGYLYGLGLFGVGVGWLHISINLFAGVNLVGAYTLTFLLVAYLSLFPAVVGYLGSCLPIRSDYRYFLVVMPALWTLGEWVRSWLFTGFPWLTLGYTQTSTFLSGYGSLVGTFGVSFIITFLAGVCVLLTRSDRRMVLTFTLLAVLVSGWLCRAYQWTDDADSDISVALIQGAVPQEVKWLPEHRNSTLERYLTITEPFWGYDLIIWPETAVPAYLHNALDFLGKLDEVAKSNDSIVLVGLPAKDLDTGEYFNSLLLLGDKQQVYNKRHLVPFGEYVPLKSLLDRPIAALGIPMSHFTPGDGDSPPLFHGNGFSMGLSICYEAVFGNEIIKAIPTANVLVNVSNDAWFGDSASPHQHLQMAQMRAVETGRYLLRATNTGISAIINEKGKIIGKTRQFEPDAVATEIPLFTGSTPYALTGDMPIVLLSLLLLLVGCYNRNW